MIRMLLAAAIAPFIRPWKTSGAIAATKAVRAPATGNTVFLHHMGMWGR